MSCIPFPGEYGGICSGRGICDNVTSICICEFPFTNVGDFATDKSVDCGIHFIATKALWGICAGVEFYLLLQCIRTLIRRWGKNRIEVALTFSCVVDAIFIGTAAVLEASASVPGERSIGTDLLTTFMFAIGTSNFWIRNNYFFLLLLGIMIKQTALFSDKHKRLQLRAMKLIRLFFPIQCGLCLFACFAVLGIYFNPGNDQLFASFHYLILGFSLILNLCVTYLATYPIVQQIREAMKISQTVLSSNGKSQAKLEKSLTVFTMSMRNNLSQALPQITLAILFGAIPVLTRKSAYWIPIAWSGGAVGCVGIIQIWGTKASPLEDETQITSAHDDTIQQQHRVLSVGAGSLSPAAVEDRSFSG